MITDTPPSSPRGVIRRTPPVSPAPARRSSSRDSVFLPDLPGQPAYPAGQLRTTPYLSGSPSQPDSRQDPSSSGTSDSSGPPSASGQSSHGHLRRSRIPRLSPSNPRRDTPLIVISSPASSTLPTLVLLPSIGTPTPGESTSSVESLNTTAPNIIRTMRSDLTAKHVISSASYPSSTMTSPAKSTSTLQQMLCPPTS